MLAIVTAATDSLNNLSVQLSTFWTDQPYHRATGSWNVPPLTRRDLTRRVLETAARLSTLRDADVDDDLEELLGRVPDQLQWFQTTTMPNMQNGNAYMGWTVLDAILQNIDSALPAQMLPSWEEVAGSKLIPKELAQRIRSLESALTRMSPEAERLDEKIGIINEAHSAAVDLPTDVQALRDARVEIERDTRASKKALAAVEEAETRAGDFLATITDRTSESEKLVSRIDTAYSAATTVGLAASFSERAKSLERSTWLWVAMLFTALVVGGVVGYFRVDAFQHSLASGAHDAGWLIASAATTVFSIAAPVWFSWLATRQIGQRFRLAEDYGYKATVARAYEGFRKEAIRLDPKLEARLFSSALDRLDEAPLRFISIEEYSSPYEALLASSGFQKLIDKIPGVDREAFAESLTAGLKKGRRGRAGKARAGEDESSAVSRPAED